MNSSYFDNKNNIISLDEDEDNSFTPQRYNRPKKQITNKSKSSNSFFGKIINSVSKIGQGLKNIMSMKINYGDEDEDDFNKNIYDNVLNRFNNNEEINLIDAPSFMEESNIQNQSNKKNDSNIMMISQNEINNNENSIKNFENSFNNKNEEIINTDIEPKEERKYRIKSTFLNKKRNNDRNIDVLKGNNFINKNKGENSLNSSRIKINNSNSKINKTNNKLLNNSSLMNISMRSLNSIKGDINKIKQENLHLVEEMHKRYNLNYDSNKEQQIRQKILEDYYKEKAKRMEEEKHKLLQIQEELKRMKKRENQVKHTSTQTKPAILSETKNEQIHFKSNINNINNLNNKNNFNLSQKEIVKQPNTFPKANPLYGTNITFGDTSNSQSQNNENKVDNNSSKENTNNITNNNINIKKEETKPKETINLFGQKETPKNENNTKKEKEKEKEVKTNTPLFANLGGGGGLFNLNQPAENNPTPSLFGNTSGNNANIVNEKKEPKEKFNNKKTSIFESVTVPNVKIEEKKEVINLQKEKKQDDFFASSSTNLKINKEDSISNSLFKGDNSKNIFGRQISSEKGGLFDQNTQVSKAINQQSLFSSNKDGNTENTLVNDQNPFLNGGNSNKGSSTNLFGFGAGNENNKQGQQSSGSIFPAFSFGAPGNSKSLFG